LKIQFEVNMKRLVTLFALLLLAGCQSGSILDAQPDGQAPEGLNLELTAAKAGSGWAVTLHSADATDLYQLAGTIRFDPGKYRMVNSEAGGGLGGPEDCLFLAEEAHPGRMAFAYTRRIWGEGASGDMVLLRLTVEPQGQFSLADFELLTGNDELLARDSHKRRFETQIKVREAAQ
jgi:hypothetical protein